MMLIFLKFCHHWVFCCIFRGHTQTNFILGEGRSKENLGPRIEPRPPACKISISPPPHPRCVLTQVWTVSDQRSPNCILSLARELFWSSRVSCHQFLFCFSLFLNTNTITTTDEFSSGVHNRDPLHRDWEVAEKPLMLWGFQNIRLSTNLDPDKGFLEKFFEVENASSLGLQIRVLCYQVWHSHLQRGTQVQCCPLYPPTQVWNACRKTVPLHVSTNSQPWGSLVQQWHGAFHHSKII